MIVFQNYIASYPYSCVPTLMKRLEADGQLELLEAVRKHYATMKPNQRIRVIHHDSRITENSETYPR